MSGGFEPTRWWRIRNPATSGLWLETSDVAEAHREATTMGWPLERRYQRVEQEWRAEGPLIGRRVTTTRDGLFYGRDEHGTIESVQVDCVEVRLDGDRRLVDVPFQWLRLD